MSSDNSGAAARTPRRDSGILPALTIGVAAVAMLMVWSGRSSLLEGVSFVTGAVCVWLTVRASVWNFPIGLVNTATFSVVFFEARLFGDAALQVVYFALGLAGWYLWLYGGERRSALKVVHASRQEIAVVAGSVLVMTLALWRALQAAGGSASFWDAATTSGSLGAQWLLTRKRLETWYLWILVDIVYVPLYVSRGLNLTAVLYAVFLVMAVLGLVHWRGLAHAEPSGRSDTLPEASLP